MKLGKHIAAVFLSTTLMSVDATAAPVLTPESLESSAGYYQLSWTGDADDFVLTESLDPGFSTSKVVYQGKDTATVISGKPDGIYYYRIRTASNASSRSNIATIHVKHHPLSRALVFFAVGALVFFSTLFVVIHGNRTTNRNRE